MMFLVTLGTSLADFSNDVQTIRNDILPLTHPQHRFMSLQGFASERNLSADEMSERLLAAADGLRDGTNANEEALCRYAIWGLGHFGSDRALARLEEYVLSVRANSNNPFSTTPLQLAALTAYERITHGDERFQSLLSRAVSAGAIGKSWIASFSRDNDATKTIKDPESKSTLTTSKVKDKTKDTNNEDCKQQPIVDNTFSSKENSSGISVFSKVVFLLPGIAFLIVGLALFWFPPKKINNLYGYRTSRSRRNIESWNFAQRYSAKVTIWASLANIFVCLCGDFIAHRAGLTVSKTMTCDTIVELAALLSLMAAVFALTERALAKRGSSRVDAPKCGYSNSEPGTKN